MITLPRQVKVVLQQTFACKIEKDNQPAIWCHVSRFLFFSLRYGLRFVGCFERDLPAEIPNITVRGQNFVIAFDKKERHVFPVPLQPALRIRGGVNSAAGPVR